MCHNVQMYKNVYKFSVHFTSRQFTLQVCITFFLCSHHSAPINSINIDIETHLSSTSCLCDNPAKVKEIIPNRCTKEPSKSRWCELHISGFPLRDAPNTSSSFFSFLSKFMKLSCEICAKCGINWGNLNVTASEWIQRIKNLEIKRQKFAKMYNMFKFQCTTNLQTVKKTM